MIPVGDRALVLHAEVRRLDELVPVFIPREWAKPCLEALEHWLYLLELLARGLDVVVEWPEVERQVSFLPLVHVTEMRVPARIDGDVVVVDWIADEPFVGRRAVGIHRRFTQATVRHVDQ